MLPLPNQRYTPPDKPFCYADSGVFSRHYRKVKILFGLTDIALTAIAFIAAYVTRARLNFERVFFMTGPEALLLLILAALSWLAVGYWLNIYEKLDSAHRA